MLLSLFLAMMGCIKSPGSVPSPTPEVAVSALPYPESPRGEVMDVMHGVEVDDPYRWLEDMGSEATRRWVTEQNLLTEAHLAQFPDRQAILDKLQTHWGHPRFGVPDTRGGRKLAVYNSGQMPQDVLRVQQGDGEARLLLDPVALAGDTTTAILGASLNPSGSHAMVMLSEQGSDWRTIRIIEVETGALLPDRVEWCKFTWPRWNPEGTGFWYARYDAPTQEASALGNQQVFFHHVGTAQSEDRLVISEPEHPKWGFGALPSDDGKWLYIQVWSGTAERNQMWYRPIEQTQTPFVRLFDDFGAKREWLGAEEHTLWLLTDVGAPNRRIMAVDIQNPAVQNWTEVVAESDNNILSAHRIGGRFVVHRTQDAVSILEVWDEQGHRVGTFDLPPFATVEDLRGHADSPEFSLSLTGFLIPTAVFQANTETLELRAQSPAASHVDGSPFVTQQVFYASRDGTRVPLFITHAKDLDLTGDHPTILYGYGGFNNAVQPRFREAVLTWLEMGGIYASANLRGGSEYGQTWHDAGTRTHKQNVFDDFIAAAEHLVSSGYTRPERLAIQGRSNGGLLVGATMLQRPDLFGAALPSVGVMDMLRYHRFTIGWAWASDYGTVDDSAEMFQALHAYSPVHNARPGDYPATLVTTADHDDRVVPLHSYKFTAALQHAQQDSAPVLLRVDTGAGHGAGRSTLREQQEWADRLSFLAKEFEMEVPW